MDLLIFDSEQSPLPSPEKLEQSYQCTVFDADSPWLVLGVQWRYDTPSAPEEKVRYNSPVIEPGLVIKRFSKPVFSLLLAPTQTPIHIDVPDVRVHC